VVRQAHLILVTGLPGTGKSTLARALAARYRMPIVCKDTIKEPLLDVLGASDRSQSRKLSDASFAVMFALAREVLRAGANLILEGNFRPGEHEAALEALILESPIVRLMQILCRTSEPVRIARLQARATDPTRHPGHRDADLATAAQRTGQPSGSTPGPARNAPGPGYPAALDFLALPGERLVFDSDARSAAEVDASQLHHLLDTLDHWPHADP
jgi:predicted kinase